jgi:hypothetical protein
LFLQTKTFCVTARKSEKEGEKENRKETTKEK